MNRMVCFNLLALLVHGVGGFSTLHSKVEEVPFRSIAVSNKSGGMWKINPHGPLNPAIGFLINKLKLDCSMRMFSSQTEESIRFHRILTRLFPCNNEDRDLVVTEINRSIFRAATDSRNVKVKFMAALMALSLGMMLEYTATFEENANHVKIPSLDIKFAGKKENLEEIRDVLEYLSNPDKEVSDRPMIDEFLESKRFILQSFLFKFLDDKNDMELFLSTLLRILNVNGNKDLFDRCFVPFDYEDTTDYGLLDKLVKFPFYELNLMQPNTVSAFKRSHREFLSNSKHEFRDNVELSMLKLVCCLVHDSAKDGYSVDHLKNTASLKEFFENDMVKTHPFKLDTNIRQAWAVVVQDLDDPRIVYRKKVADSRNQVDSGLLNLLLVLMNTCGLTDSDLNSKLLFSETEISTGAHRIEKEKMIIKEFKRVFEKIVDTLKCKKNGKNYKISYDEELSIDVVEGRSRPWDIFGRITIILDTEDTFQKVVVLDHGSRHAVNINILQRRNEEVIDRLLSSGNILDLLIANSIIDPKSILQQEMDRLVDKSIYIPFLHEASLNDNNYRLMFLKALNRRLRNESDDDARRKTQKLMHKLIPDSAFSNEEMITRRYRMFFFTNEEVLDRFLETNPSIDTKTSALTEAIESRTGDDGIIHDFLKGNCDDMCKDRYRLESLAHVIFSGNRKDLLEILSERKYPGLNIYLFHNALAVRDYSAAVDLFKKIEIGEMIEIEHGEPEAERLLAFLDILMSENGIDEKEALKKAYCYCFHSNTIDFASATALLRQTHSNQNLPIDFIYDYIGKNPNVVAFDFHQLLLNRALVGKNDIRRDVVTMIKCAAKLTGGEKNFLGSRERKKSEEIGKLVSEVELRELIYGDVPESGNIFPLIADSYLKMVRGIPKRRRMDEFSDQMIDNPLYYEKHDEYVSSLNSLEMLTQY